MVFFLFFGKHACQIFHICPFLACPLLLFEVSVSQTCPTALFYPFQYLVNLVAWLSMSSARLSLRSAGQSQQRRMVSSLHMRSSTYPSTRTKVKVLKYPLWYLCVRIVTFLWFNASLIANVYIFFSVQSLQDLLRR